MVNYKNGKIYKIVSTKTNKIYIGSTTKKYLSERMASHRCDYQSYKYGTHGYVSSYDILKYKDAMILLLETYPCKSKDALFVREQFWKDLYQDICVNINNTISKSKYAYYSRKIYNNNYHKTHQYYCDICCKKIHRQLKKYHPNTKVHKDNKKYIFKILEDEGIENDIK